MSSPDQRSGSILSPDTREEPHHGCGGGQCSPHVWNANVEPMGSQASGDVTNGSILCHDPYLWHIEEAIQIKSAGLYDQQ